MGMSFVFSTGRCGTLYLSKVLTSKDTYISHEEEPGGSQAMLKYFLRPYAITANEEALLRYMAYKQSYIKSKLRITNKNSFLETGHLSIYGILPYYIKNVKDLKIIRLRRNRYDTALSFLTMEEKYDIWNVNTLRDNSYRWTAHPWDRINVSTPTEKQWSKLNRVQKYFWAIDEIEHKWQYYTKNYDFDYIEIEFVDIIGEKISLVADFLNVDVDKGKISHRFNSTESRGLVRQEIDLEKLVQYDQEYKEILSSK